MNKITTREIHIDGHKLAALVVNPDASGTPNILIHGLPPRLTFGERSNSLSFAGEARLMP